MQRLTVLYRSDLRQVSQGAFCITTNLALTALTENPYTWLYIPVIVTTDSKELTSVLLYLLSIKIEITFNFQFLKFQKAI